MQPASAGLAFQPTDSSVWRHPSGDPVCVRPPDVTDRCKGVLPAPPSSQKGCVLPGPVSHRPDSRKPTIFRGGRNGGTLPCLVPPISIIVSIGTLHQRAVAPTDVIYLPDSKTASRSHGHTSNMRARMFACGHNGLDQIVSLEPMHSLVGFRTGAREAVLIHRAHLSPPAPNGLNTPGLQLFRRLRWIVAHTSRIQPVVFRVAQPNAVLLGAPATPERDRQSQFLERVPNRVSGGVHRRRIRKRLSGLRQYPFQSCWIMG